MVTEEMFIVPDLAQTILKEFTFRKTIKLKVQNKNKRGEKKKALVVWLRIQRNYHMEIVIYPTGTVTVRICFKRQMMRRVRTIFKNFGYNGKDSQSTIVPRRGV